MEFTNSLLEVLSFDPILLGVFAGLSMLYVQTLKSVFEYARTNPQVLVLGFTFFFSVLITFEIFWALKILAIMYLLMIGTTGLYESAKNKEANENLAGL